MMSGTTCHFCGHEVRGLYCPVCKARVAPDAPKAVYEAKRSGGAPSRRHLLRLGLLATLVAVGLGVYSYRYRIWYGPAAGYAMLIRESAQFATPVNVSVSKDARRAHFPGAINTPSALIEGSSPALVLEARGLATFDVSTTEQTRQLTPISMPSYGSFSSDGTYRAAPSPTPMNIVEKVNQVGVTLTPEGEKEAVNWTESDASQWRVPIGRREVVRIDKVGEVKSELGVEKLDVEFSWRWMPNALGEAFDGASVAFVSHDRVGTAVNEIGWSSTKSYRAVAHLERREGGEWRIVGIQKSEKIDRDKEVAAF